MSSAVFGQRRAHRDSLRMADRHKLDTLRTDTLPADTLSAALDTVDLRPRRPRSIVDFPIEYQCSDSLMVSFDDKLVFMYGKSDVKAEQMSLTSDHMRIEMNTSSIFAEGLEDSLTHERTGDPEFKDGSDEFKARVMKYNFKTKKGHVIDVETEQNNGFLFGQVTKMHPDRQIHFKGGKYTTCDAEHPHFYLNLTRAKMLPNDKIVSGPAYFVFLDVPVFILGLPFGIFPNSKKTHNGVIIPKYGEESRRGFYLQEGGYYFSFSDYADLSLTGSYYTCGSWGVRASSKFKLRYKFSGNLDFQYTTNVTGRKEFSASSNSELKPNKTKSFLLKFNFNQDSKANPNSQFSANISYDKQSFDKYNATTLNDYMKSTTSSSISYRRDLFNKKANLTISGNMTQNLYDSTVSFTAPTLAFSVNRFFPFKRKVQVGSQRWYEKIGSSFTLNIDNRVPTMKDSLLFKKEMLEQMRYGLQYKIPLSTSFNVLKFIQVSPSVTYTGRLYPNYLRRYMKNSFEFDPTGYIDEKYQKFGYSTDTISGINHVFDFNAAVSASTKLYGIFNFNKAKRIKAFRHVITPTVGLSYRPDFSEDFWGYYETDPLDSTTRYNKYANGIYSPPGAGKSGNIDFGLGNNFELKVKGRNDTIDGQYTKIKILEKLDFSSGYNMVADSFQLQNIRMTGSTRLFDQMNVTFNGTFDPYVYNDSLKRRENKFMIVEEHKLARLTNFSVSTGFTFSSKMLDKKKLDEKKKAASEFAEDMESADFDEDGNIIPVEEVSKKKKDLISEREKNGEFDYSSVPWSVQLGYRLTYQRYGRQPFSQNLDISGSVQFTDKWSMSVRSGYDFDARKMASTQISVTRNLHCFGLSFLIIPYGYMKSYNFNLSINSSMFQGIEYKRNQSWHDN